MGKITSRFPISFTAQAISHVSTSDTWLTQKSLATGAGQRCAFHPAGLVDTAYLVASGSYREVLQRDVSNIQTSPRFLEFPSHKDYLRRFHRCRVDGTVRPLSRGQASVFSGMFVFVRQQRRSWQEKEREAHQGGGGLGPFGGESPSLRGPPQLLGAGRFSGHPWSTPHPGADLWHSTEQNLSH